jgi:hypothetical protein
MSLSWFHVVFIVASIALLAWFGIWLLDRSVAAGVVSLMAAGALAGYLVFFRRKVTRERL